MRLLIYLALTVVFIAAVYFKAQIIQRKEKAEIVTFTSEWQTHGKPVDIEKARHAPLPVHEKISGVLVNNHTLTAMVPLFTRKILSRGQPFTTPHGVKGTVSSIAEAIDVTTGLYRIVLRLTSPLALPAGTLVPIRIEISRLPDVLVVRNEAVVRESARDSDETRTYCWVAEGKHAKRVPVRTGRSNGEYTQVLEGLSENSSVIVNGKAILAENDTLNIHKIIGE